MKTLYLFFVGIFLVGCQQHSKSLSEAEKKNYLTKGDSLATETQKVLLANVSAKIKEGGAIHAVMFCNEKAVDLTNSFSQNDISIQRISEKNRNANNSISSENDQKAWQEISKMTDVLPNQKHLLIETPKEIVYYKAIPLGMPTCLLCHGNPQTEIAPEVQQVISSKYPEDKATGYTMGELRGLWKITFQRDAFKER